MGEFLSMRSGAKGEHATYGDKVSQRRLRAVGARLRRNHRTIEQ